MRIFEHIPASPRPTWKSWALVLLAGLLGLAWFHKADVSSGFARISGDTGDTRLVAWLLEHSWLALTGSATIASPPMFFPVTGTFGYADAFLLQGLVFWPLRALGQDPLTALQWATLVLNGLGYASMAWLLHKVLRLGAPATILGSLLFAFNSAKFNQFVHVQLQPLVLLPLMVALLVDLGRGAQALTPKQAFWRLAALALLLDVQLLTGVYVGWFFGFWCLICLVLMLVLPATRRWLLDLARRWWQPLAAAAAVFLAAAVPFLLLYVPVLRQSGWRSFGDAQGMIPRWFSLLLMGDGNLMWAWLERVIPGLYQTPFYWEHRIGLGLVVTVSWLVLSVLAIRTVRQLPAQQVTTRTWLVLLVLSVTAYYLLGMKYFGHSPWWFAFHTTPGIKSIRAVSRYVIVLALPIGIALGYALDAALAHARTLAANRARGLTAWLAGLAMLAVAEQAGQISGCNKANELARLDRLASRLPQGCDAFFVTSTPESKLSLTELQIDAMWVAQKRGVPTLNGYSGQDPKGWHLYQVREPDYRQRVQAWVAERNVVGRVCELADPD